MLSAIEELGIGAGFATLLHVLFAGTATLHVLRHKREVGAAMAWIGVAWLSPFFGAALYFGFGINRVKRRARRLRSSRPIAGERGGARRVAPIPDHLEALDRAAGCVTDRPMLGGNRVEMLRSGDETYPPMIAAIDGAKRSIALASYIFRADAVGDRFIDALLRAHQRGVAVRVLIDGVGGGYFFTPTWRKLKRAGVPAALFLHTFVPWRMPFLNLRNHRKILCVDGQLAFTGGINIGKENMRDSDPRHAVRDTHFRLEGPVVAQLAEAFAEDWFFAAGEELDGDAWFPALAPAGNVSARAVTSGPDEDYEKIELVVLHAISCARRSIRILTPYFLPHDGLITALELAAMRGVQVDIILPSQTDLPVVDWARRAQIRPLIDASGCQVFLTPPPFEHSKLLVIDEAWALVGSANWDARSFRLNFELNVEVRDVDLVRQITELIDRKRGPQLTGDQFARYPFLLELRDSAARLLLPYL
ncbi:MAG TPA: phospholipase D-like domain-containing protein [Reyranellaceae bacterium]|nr:phospholipase D-like domain-containing protein [Reyranellaceae bacterium]